MMIRTYSRYEGHGRDIRLNGKTTVKKKLISKDANITRSIGLCYALKIKMFFGKNLFMFLPTSFFLQ